MEASLQLLKSKRFAPLFVTQMLGAFNDNLFKNALILFVVYSVYSDPKAETWFSAIATGLVVLPFFLLSALSGQLADQRDKARIIRIVKAAEVIIMLAGGAGLFMAWLGWAIDLVAIPLMLLALFAMGVHSTFFGPIKYAILRQHLDEAGTYIAILAGTILAGLIPVEVAAACVILTAIIGYIAGRQVPPAPPQGKVEPLDFHVIRSSITLIRSTMEIPRLFLAILSISLFWTVGTVLFIQFPPLVKNVLMADRPVASLFLGIFSIGVSIGSIAINRMLRGEVSARYAPASVIAMGICVVAFHLVCASWTVEGTQLMGLDDFFTHPQASLMVLTLLGVAISGGMFVVPLYAFLTTTVAKDQAARTVAANNIINSGAMVIGSLITIGMSLVGISVVNQLLFVAVMCLASAWMAQKLHRACD